MKKTILFVLFSFVCFFSIKCQTDVYLFKTIRDYMVDIYTHCENRTQEGAIELVREYVKNKYDINERFEYEDTLLHKAASLGLEKVVECLINNGANVNAIDSFGRTVLSQCLEHPNIVKMLIYNGANPLAQMNDVVLKNMTIIEYCSYEIKCYKSALKNRNTDEQIRKFYEYKLQKYRMTKEILTRIYRLI